MGSEREQGGDDNKDMTDEMDAYYESKNSRSGSTILYGLFALVVTLIVAAGLYFGGRAVYRALTGTSGDSETTTQEDGNTSSTSEDNNDTDQTNGSDNQTPGVESDTPDGDSESNQNNSGGSSEDMPSTGDNLPSTGSPAGI